MTRKAKKRFIAKPRLAKLGVGDSIMIPKDKQTSMPAAARLLGIKVTTKRTVRGKTVIVTRVE